MRAPSLQVDPGDELLPLLLDAAARGLRHYLGDPSLRAPAHRRLAFRELGLAIGLAAVPTIRAALERVDRRQRAHWPSSRDTPAWVKR